MGGEDRGLRGAFSELMRELIAEELQASEPRTPPVTMSTYAGLWLAQRRQLQLVSVSSDETRMRRYVLPQIGAMYVRDVHPKHIRALILSLVGAKQLSPRSIRHVFAVLRSLFRAAVADELILTSPCTLPVGVLPPSVDKDPEWRAKAFYSRKEIEALVSDSRIVPWRRVMSALKFFSALRHSEASTLRWRQIEPRTPLNAILLGKTKAKRPRVIPIHPTLQWILEDWRVRGFRELMGHSPTTDELVVPTLRGTPRARNNTQRALLADLAMLGWRRRRGHDFRRAMITYAREDGADRDKLKAVTHGQANTVMDLYTTWPFETLCAEIMKLNISVSRGRQLELPLMGWAKGLEPSASGATVPHLSLLDSLLALDQYGKKGAA